MINQYELRKIYIAELGFDPHLQMAWRSEFKVKNAKKEILKIITQYEDPYEAEGALLKSIKDNAKNLRKKEYAGFLLQFGFEGFKDKAGMDVSPIISAEAYEYARENYFGVKEIDDETKEKIDSMKMKNLDIRNNDPFAVLDESFETPQQRLKRYNNISEPSLSQFEQLQGNPNQMGQYPNK